MGQNPIHADVQVLLPWLINDTLGDRERKKVLRHLRECRECRQERDRLQHLEQEILSAAEAEWPDYRFPYRKLMARIDAAERQDDVQEPNRGGSFRRSWFSMMGAAATLVLGVLFVASTQQPSVETDDQDFQGLTVPSTEVDGVERRMALTFEEGVPSSTVRAALIEARSKLIRGPDETGTYVVEVRAARDMSDAEVIESIRAIQGVKHVALHQDQGIRPSR